MLPSSMPTPPTRPKLTFPRPLVCVALWQGETWIPYVTVTSGDGCNNCPAGSSQLGLAPAGLREAGGVGGRRSGTCRSGTAATGGRENERALDHTREEAHDKIRPVASIGQVQAYMDHHCNNTTDRRILLMFLNICSDLNKLCQKLEALHPGTSVTNNILEKCKLLVSPSNDLSTIRAKYPHDVVNHLSCDEAKNHYGGVVSLIPIVLDCMKSWVANSEKLPRNFLQNAS
ncbi:unnamed protein product [Caretta caretta]